MVFKFFTLTFSLLLAIFITVLKSASLETTVTICGFQKFLELERGLLPPAELYCGPPSVIGGRCGDGEPCSGPLCSLALCTAMQTPFIYHIHVCITQGRLGRSHLHHLPGCLFITAFPRSCHHDPRH